MDEAQSNEVVTDQVDEVVIDQLLARTHASIRQSLDQAVDVDERLERMYRRAGQRLAAHDRDDQQR